MTQAEHNGDTPRKGCCRREVGRAVWFVLIGLALCELALRLAGLTTPVLYERDTAVGYRLKPGQTARYLANRVTINDWGVRDPRVLDDNAGGPPRVLVLGDSVTWGGLRKRQRDLFTSVMERTLGDTQVVNAGVNGYSVSQMVALYRQHLSGLRADHLVVCALPRDFTRQPYEELTAHSMAFPLRRPRCALAAACALGRVEVGRRLGWTWLRGASPTRPVGPVLTETECVDQSLAALGELQRNLKPSLRLTVIIMPTMPGAPGGPLLAEAASGLDRLGLQWVDLTRRMTPSSELFGGDGVHLSVIGHARVG